MVARKARRILFEVGDVSQILNLSTTRVIQLAERGDLVLAAVTPRGLRLFEPEDVGRYKEKRERERAGRP